MGLVQNEAKMVASNRREQLRMALAGREIKPNDRSYISQLLSGTASFGEKAARRLERDYLLPPFSLDCPIERETPGQISKADLIARILVKLENMHIKKLEGLAALIDA